MKNPLLQAERQHKLMEQLLADAKQACPVHSFVYFANKNARVGVRDARIYTDETSLRRAIQSAPEPGRPVDAASAGCPAGAGLRIVFFARFRILVAPRLILSRGAFGGKNKGDNTPDAKILSGLARPMCLIDGKGGNAGCRTRNKTPCCCGWRGNTATAWCACAACISKIIIWPRTWRRRLFAGRTQIRCAGADRFGKGVAYAHRCEPL